MSASAAVSEKNLASESVEDGGPERSTPADTGLESKWGARRFEFLVFLSMSLLISALAFMCAQCHVSRLERNLLHPAGQRSVFAEPEPEPIEIRLEREGMR
jgi:hypothetical protein